MWISQNLTNYTFEPITINLTLNIRFQISEEMSLQDIRVALGIWNMLIRVWTFQMFVLKYYIKICQSSAPFHSLSLSLVQRSKHIFNLLANTRKDVDYTTLLTLTHLKVKFVLRFKGNNIRKLWLEFISCFQDLLMTFNSLSLLILQENVHHDKY